MVELNKMAPPFSTTKGPLPRERYKPPAQMKVTPTQLPKEPTLKLVNAKTKINANQTKTGTKLLERLKTKTRRLARKIIEATTKTKLYWPRPQVHQQQPRCAAGVHRRPRPRPGTLYNGATPESGI